MGKGPPFSGKGKGKEKGKNKAKTRAKVKVKINLIGIPLQISPNTTPRMKKASPKVQLKVLAKARISTRTRANKKVTATRAYWCAPTHRNRCSNPLRLL